ncbi:MAG TPA: hypothetical protein VKA44_07330, partial [Gemmatimonadota bacterium]|nr:hypothetical protein [Gemmatimonadota bacterium]
SELLERRSTFQDWLERLDGRSGDVRSDVYERVRADYLDRLASVEEELSGHRDGLADSLARCHERLESLEAEREERAASLEEAELRHAVGEYSDEEWEGLRDEHQGALSDLDGRLEEERGAASRFEEVLGELDAGAADAPEPAAAFTAEVEAGVDGAAASGPALVEEEPAGARDRGADRADEDDVLAFLGETDAGRRDGQEAPDEEPGAPQRQLASGPRREPDEEDRGDGLAEDPGEDLPEGYDEEDFEDELDFLESLSLDDASSLDTLSLVLDEGEEEAGGGDEDDEEEDRGGAP